MDEDVSFGKFVIGKSYLKNRITRYLLRKQRTVKESELVRDTSKTADTAKQSLV